MSASGARAFGTSSKAALNWFGATPSEILAANPGQKGELALSAIRNFERTAETKVSN